MNRTVSRAFVPGTFTALVAVVGAIRLGDASLWLDEAASRSLARARWGDFINVVADREANMSLYYVLLRIWRAIFGESETALRSLSLVAAVAAVPLLWALAVRLFDRRVAVVACALLSVNGFMLHYAHQTRGYTLVLALVIGSTLLLVRAVESPATGRWLLYGFVAAASVYAHFFAGFVLLAHIVVLIAVRRRVRLKTIGPGVALLAVLISPLGLFMLTQQGAQVAWIPRTTLRTLVPTFTALTGLGGKPLLIAYFLACVAGLIGIIRSAQDGATWKGLLVVAWALLPAIVAFGVSLAVPIVRPQYLIVMVPALCLLAATGIARLNGWGRVVAAGALLGLAVAALPATYRGFQSHDWRSAARYVMTNAKSSDGAVFYAYYGWVPFSYYATQYRGPLFDSDYPPAVWDSRDIIESQPFEPYRQRAIAHQRIWLVLNNARTDHPTAELALLLNELNRGFRRTAYREFQGGIRIGLYERTGFTPLEPVLTLDGSLT